MREGTEQEDGGARECRDSQGTQSTILGETLSYRKYEEVLSVSGWLLSPWGDVVPRLPASGPPGTRFHGGALRLPPAGPLICRATCCACPWRLPLGA